MVVAISRPAPKETVTGKTKITECNVCEIPSPQTIKQRTQTMYQHQTLHYGIDFRKSIEHKSLNPFFENDQHGQSNFLIKRVVEHIRHKSLHDVACNAQTHEALSAATTQTPKPPPPHESEQTLRASMPRAPWIRSTHQQTEENQNVLSSMS